MFGHLVSKLDVEQRDDLLQAIGLLHRSGFLDLILEESEAQLKAAALQAAHNSEQDLNLRDTARRYATILGITESLRPQE